MPPSVVNLIALAIRLPMICSKRAGSALRSAPSAGSIITESSSPLARTSAAQITVASSISRISETGSALQPHLAGLEAGKIEQVIEQRKHLTARIRQYAQRARLTGVQRRLG